MAQETAGDGDAADLLDRCWRAAQCSPLPMALVQGTDHVVRHINSAFCHLLGQSEEDLVGSAFAGVVPRAGEFLLLLDRVYRTGRAEIHAGHEQPASHRLYWSYVVWPVRAVDGSTRAMMIQVTETTPFVLQSTAMNQALIESSVHQHELAQAAEKREETAVKEQERLAERVHITSEELDRSKGELRALAASLLTAQEAERQRIARDLHDNVAQRLAVIEMELAQLGQEAKRWEPRLSAVLSQVADVSTDIRQLSHDLHPTLLETFGLAVALRHLCQEWQRVAHLAIEYSSPPVTRPWPLPVGAALYRITQEALRNIKKHASGTRATVTLAENEQGIQLTIVDDGCGFNPTAVRHRGGMGLVSMHERVVTIHGLLEVQSRPGEGTTIRVAIPWQEEV